MNINNKNKINIAIASGKGGTGKTMLALSLFNSIKNKYDDVILLDADAEEPNDLIFFDAKEISYREITQKVPVIDTNKCTFCGKCRDWCNYNAIFILPKTKFIRVTEELCHGCGACTVACKFGAITEKDASLGSVKSFICDGKENLYEAKMHQGVMTPVNVIKAAKKITKKHKIKIFDSPPGT
ncbi:MAG: 4Fe-4S binding protein, partial [Bacteroidales bacterium]|nr:4Fe-4S binding protein [Bacteroidales bacterium]